MESELVMFEYALVEAKSFYRYSSDTPPVSVADAARKQINDHAELGWRVVSMVPYETTAYLILFEREVQSSIEQPPVFPKIEKEIIDLPKAQPRKRRGK